MIKMISYKEINKGRQYELDIARGLAVLFMILIHVTTTFATPEILDSSFGKIVGFLGTIPAAPVFMFVMGVGMVYSNRNDYFAFLRRGIILLIAGYVLNALRGFIPQFINFIMVGEDMHLQEALMSLITVDILQFAGLAMIFFAIIKKFRINKVLLTIITILLCGSNFFLVDFTVDEFYLGALTGLFWGSNATSQFPFFTWIFYPVAGYFFGDVLIRCRDKRRLYIQCLGGSVFFLLGAIIVFYKGLGYDIGFTSMWSFYHHNLVANFIYTSFIVMWISLIHSILNWIPGILHDTFTRWSRNVTYIYFIHYILIGWIVLLVGRNMSNIWLVLTLFVGIAIISDIIAAAIKHYTHDSLF